MKSGHRIYLDSAAALPTHKEALRAFLRAQKHFGNPSSPHEEGRLARKLLEESRVIVARETGVKADEVIFTSGATEANALLIHGHVKALRSSGRASSDIQVFYLRSAHASTGANMMVLLEEGIRVDEIPIKDGKIDVALLSTLLTKDTALIALEAVCSETGTRWNVREMRRLLDEHYAPLARPLIHVDATQAPLIESPEKSRYLCDTLSLDGSKIGGVRGCGALIAPRNTLLLPLYEGGGQERGLRSGTEGTALIAAFSSALSSCATSRVGFAKRAKLLREILIKKLSVVPSLVINEGASFAPHILNISLPGKDTEYLVALLSKEGYAVATKSACETDESLSRAVMALTGDMLRASSTLRISFAPSTTKHEIDGFSRAFSRSVAFLERTRI